MAFASDRAGQGLLQLGSALPNEPDGLASLLLTSFVGRRDLVAAVTDRLLRDEIRLLTLTGPGGVGKTRLALRVAAEVGDAFPDGVTFVALAPLTDPALVLSTIAHAVGMRVTGERPLLERL